MPTVSSFYFCFCERENGGEKFGLIFFLQKGKRSSVASTCSSSFFPLREKEGEKNKHFQPLPNQLGGTPFFPLACCQLPQLRKLVFSDQFPDSPLFPKPKNKLCIPPTGRYLHTKTRLPVYQRFGTKKLGQNSFPSGVYRNLILVPGLNEVFWASPIALQPFQPPLLFQPPLQF